MVERTNAICEPSGENLGDWSSDPPGGDVSRRVLWSDNDSNEIHERGESTPLASGNARNFPFGDQASPPPMAAGAL